MRIEREQNAQDAINQFVPYCCAFLVPGREHQVAAGVGSGVIVQTSGENVVILTAKHIAEDAQSEEYRLGYYKCSNPISDFVAGIMLFPGDVDVGLLVVKGNLAESVKDLAVTQDTLHVDGKDIVEQDIIILNGYPAQTSRYDQDRSEQGFKLVTYWCVPENVSLDDQGRYRLEWKDATVWRGEQTFDLPSPKGMSGGPLWRFRKPDQTSLWSARTIGKIIGIQSAWDQRKTVLIEPIRGWSDWLHESLVTVDEAFGKPL